MATEITLGVMIPRVVIGVVLAGALGCVPSPQVGSRSPYCLARPIPRMELNPTVFPASVTRIEGRVVWATDSMPLRHAAIRLEAGDRQRNVAVDSAGAFVFDSLPAGSYVILTRALGFEVRRDTVDLQDRMDHFLIIPLIPNAVHGC